MRMTDRRKVGRMAAAKSKLLSILLLGMFLDGQPAFAASGMFPKMPAAAKVYVFTISNDSGDAKVTARALQGMLNQQSAEVYLITNPRDWEQLKSSGKPFEVVEPLTGPDPGLRTLFKKYQSRVKKVIVYENVPDWSGYLALMTAAQQGGMVVTEPMWHHLAEEFDWKGPVENFQKKWTNKIAAYDWALANLMPGCNKQVVFASWIQLPLDDYMVASKGFCFELDFNAERAEVQKIFRTQGYGVGTSLMGYANTGDLANNVSNPFGIGYVVSDLYANGSFWSSFPNKTYTQTPGRAIAAQPGKVYASIMWSDGDNIQFDQIALYKFWHDPARGQIPVATTMGTTLQELNSPLLDWYYSNATTNDELVAGAPGVQFIHIRDYNPELYPAWCKLNRDWLDGAGFSSVYMWLMPWPTAKYVTYMKTCGRAGTIGEFFSADPTLPSIPNSGVGDEAHLFEVITRVKPKANQPVFRIFIPTTGNFDRGDERGFTAIKRQIDRVEAAYPGRYVFMLPKDQFATLRAYYGQHPPAQKIAARPDTSEGLTAVSNGDGPFTTVERNGVRCWLVPKQTSPNYLYFDAANDFLPQFGGAVEVAVTYLDAGSGDVVLHYDSTDFQSPTAGAYKGCPDVIHRANSGQWKVARFRMNDARFADRENGGSDFRFYNKGDDLLISAVEVTRIKP